MFYKFENNQLYCNGTLMGDLYSLYPEEEGWRWFTDEVTALTEFNVDVETYENGIILVDR